MPFSIHKTHLEDLPDRPDLQDLQGLQDLLARQALRVHQARQEVQALQVRQECHYQVLQALQVLREHLLLQIKPQIPLDLIILLCRMLIRGNGRHLHPDRRQEQLIKYQIPSIVALNFPSYLQIRLGIQIF